MKNKMSHLQHTISNDRCKTFVKTSLDNYKLSSLDNCKMLKFLKLVYYG